MSSPIATATSSRRSSTLANNNSNSSAVNSRIYSGSSTRQPIHTPLISSQPVSFLFLNLCYRSVCLRYFWEINQSLNLSRERRLLFFDECWTLIYSAEAYNLPETIRSSIRIHPKLLKIIRFHSKLIENDQELSRSQKSLIWIKPKWFEAFRSYPKFDFLI